MVASWEGDNILRLLLFHNSHGLIFSQLDQHPKAISSSFSIPHCEQVVNTWKRCGKRIRRNVRDFGHQKRSGGPRLLVVASRPPKPQRLYIFYQCIPIPNSFSKERLSSKQTKIPESQELQFIVILLSFLIVKALSEICSSRVCFLSSLHCEWRLNQWVERKKVMGKNCRLCMSRILSRIQITRK